MVSTNKGNLAFLPIGNKAKTKAVYIFSITFNTEHALFSISSCTFAYKQKT